MSGAFSGATKLVNVPTNIPSSITDISFMFNAASSFNQAIRGWMNNTSNITTMASCFNGATAFNKNIRYWSVGASATLTNMFNGATAFQTAWWDQGYTGYETGSGTQETPLVSFFDADQPSLSFICSNLTTWTLPISTSSNGQIMLLV